MTIKNPIHTLSRGKTSEAPAPALGAFLGVLSCLLFCVGCETASNDSAAVFGGDGKVGSHILAPGDVIDVAFPSAVELSKGQKIRRDGKISLPMVGEVVAAGKTPKSLQDELTGKYEAHLQDPKVIVRLESSSAVVYVNGEVRGGGKVVLERPMTVFEVIMESGGFSPAANPKKVILTRQEGGKLHRHVLNLKAGSADGVFPVKPFDTITVSQSWF